MEFGPIPPHEASGAVLAHALMLPSGKLPKGHVLTKADCQAIAEAGIERVICARLAPGDLGEDAAAEAIASAIRAPFVRRAEAGTGRVNLFAEKAGLFVADKAVIDAVNRIDPAITIATLDDHKAVAEGAMVATVKIIPLAVSGTAVETALQILARQDAFAVRPYTPRKVGLVATELPSLKASVMDKTAALTAERLSASSSRLIGEKRVAHRAEAVAEAIRDFSGEAGLIIIFGASAVTDERDVIPEAIRLAGGEVKRVGLPVDPGNLLVLGRIGEIDVIGAPGCARSPKENAFDWVLARILSGEPVDDAVLTGWGVGGLLMEIPTRPRPRALGHDGPDLTIGIVLLAAGKSSRMGEGRGHKLLARFDGMPLVEKSARAVKASGADEAVLVTGFNAEAIGAAAAPSGIQMVNNPDFATGMASSLKAGLKHFGNRIDGLMVALADMPGVTASDLDRLIAAFRAEGGRAIIRAVADGERGNPVILPASVFEAVMRLEGDIGARPILEKSGLPVIDVEIGAAARLDVDTPEAILQAGGALQGE